MENNCWNETPIYYDKKKEVSSEWGWLHPRYTEFFIYESLH
jgi:hypothetical protein